MASERLDTAAALLEERGHEVSFARVAVGRSGVAVGFPEDPLLHVSWWAAGAGVVVLALVRRRRRR